MKCRDCHKEIPDRDIPPTCNDCFAKRMQKHGGMQ